MIGDLSAARVGDTCVCVGPRHVRQRFSR
nr:hypothetical protein [Methylobacter marinus]